MCVDNQDESAFCAGKCRRTQTSGMVFKCSLHRQCLCVQDCFVAIAGEEDIITKDVLLRHYGYQVSPKRAHSKKCAGETKNGTQGDVGTQGGMPDDVREDVTDNEATHVETDVKTADITPESETTVDTRASVDQKSADPVSRQRRTRKDIRKDRNKVIANDSSPGKSDHEPPHFTEQLMQCVCVL